jgi:acyl-CoA reductase-like NAD-dependent aldehyde dehydrogenase
MSTVIQSYKNYVGGEWVEPLGGGSIEVVNPATGEVIAETPAGASEMPHGGFKQSGYGKDTSIYAVEEYTNINHVGISLT